MLLTAQHPISSTYPVEASGWDSDNFFFVEKCDLEWNEETGKYLTLTHSLCPGATIFLRLLLSTTPGRSLPMAYHSQPTGMTPVGQRRFRLDQMQPNNGPKNKLQ